MKFDLPRSGRTLRSLLFFSAYFTLFWLSCWCMATRCSRLYDTLFSDLLLTASFCLAFFPTHVPPPAPHCYRAEPSLSRPTAGRCGILRSVLSLTIQKKPAALLPAFWISG